MGMDVCVTLERPGFRVKKRMVMPGRVGKRHVIKKEEAIELARKRLGVSIMESGD